MTHRIEEGRQDHEQELEQRTARNEFRRPRDALLSVVSEFFATCLTRHEVQKQYIERLKITPSYYLDSKSHEVCLPMALFMASWFCAALAVFFCVTGVYCCYKYKQLF